MLRSVQLLRQRLEPGSIAISRNGICLLFLCLSVLSRTAWGESSGCEGRFVTRDGFHELQLPLQKFTSGNETTNGEAAGALAGISVGYTFEIRKSDKGEFAIRFHFSGELGENLIIALKAQLGVRTDSNRPQPSHLFEANGIADGPRLRSGLPAHFELINLHDEPNYGEWYFKLDESQRCVTLAEKNEAYREMLVRTLIGKGTD